MLLEMQDVSASYGTIQALFGVDLTVGESEVVALMGRNGMGKTTTIRTACGLMPAGKGSVSVMGKPIAGVPAYRIARLGIGLVPEGRRCFGPLSVAENLVVAARPGGWDRARVEALFPRLAERRNQHAATLSGGEQQMLAIARALMSSPDLLLLDEPSLGLAPQVVERIFTLLADLRAKGLTVLLVEQNAALALDLADRGYVLASGHIEVSGTAAELKASSEIRNAYLGA